MPKKAAPKHKPAFLSVEIGAPVADAPPKELRLFAKGKIPFKKIGSPDEKDYEFTDRSADEVMKDSKAWGIRHSMDWEHTALKKASGAIPAGDGRAPAACWYDLEVRTDGLYATNIEWTEQGKADVLSKQYKYISPAFDYDTETREIVSLINASLTNIPATRGMAPIMASAFDEGSPEEKETLMLKSAIGILGLADNATEPEALSKVAQLSTFRATVLAQTGKTSETEAIALLTAMRTAETRAVALSAELEKVKADAAKKELEDVLTQGEKDGKLAPGSKMRAHLSAMGAEAAKAFLADAPVIKTGKTKPAATDGTTPGNGGTATAELSAAQRVALERISAAFEQKPEDVEKTWVAAIKQQAIANQE